MTTTDYNFDDKVDRFAQRIYGDMKGILRFKQLWRDMSDCLPGIEHGQWQVWDAGGGLGQMSEKLATSGHRILLNDISSNMLSEARRRIPEELLPLIDIQHASIQSIAANGGQFDLIICHAVLEWLCDPQSVITQLIGALKPGGYLSLAFYNAQALRWHNAIKGNFQQALSTTLTGHPGSLTPTHPQEPDEVLTQLQNEGLTVLRCAGVRVVYDYLRRELREQRSVDNISAMEDALRLQPAFWRLGRYCHFIARRS